MPDYELYYFDVSGRAAAARILLRLAGVQFKDTRLTKEEWMARKADRAKHPFNQLPVLRVDDNYIAESMAIFNYLANEFGFYGNSNLDSARVDMVSNHLASLGSNMVKFIFEQDKELAAKYKEAFFTEQLPRSVACLEDLLVQRGDGDKFFLGEKISLADVLFLDASLNVSIMDKTYLDKSPKLKALKARIEAIPAIAEYIPTRKMPQRS